MCGIAGIIQKSPLFTGAHLRSMTNALAHRGPDGESTWHNPNETVLLGHRRLSIIDLSAAAAQPMHYRERYSIVYNGEIYNYVELREELKKRGYDFSTLSDTEVILAAYDYYKSSCVEQFDGMFAFAVWDEKEQVLFAARDRFGEKPFFYCLSDDSFLFASEMKGLWAAGMERTHNLKMLFNFITIGYADNPADPAETFFENIYKLPAASFLHYKPHAHELTVEKYWTLDLGGDDKKLTDADAVEQFSQLFTNSIKRRFRGDVMIGTCLSGGLDSSSIAAHSRQIEAASNSYQCFTAAFPGFAKDESNMAERVASHFRLQHFTVTMTGGELLNDFEKLLYHQEEPFGSASIYAQFRVYQLAKQHSIKSLLDGQGADEVLAGYAKYYKWYWQELFSKRKLISSGELSYARKHGINEKFGFNNIIAALFPEFASVFIERQYLLNALRHEDLTADFIHSQSREAYYTTPPIIGLNGALHFNTCIHGLEELLRYADRNSMAHGCEVRLPFLDYKLVEFIFSLPSHLKIREGWTKWILRKAVDEKLPPEITWRQNKIGFEPPQQEWMQDLKLQEAIQEAKKKLVLKKILKPETIDKPIKPVSAYDAENFDWRYLVSGSYL